jgi:hypothetical protein
MKRALCLGARALPIWDITKLVSSQLDDELYVTATLVILISRVRIYRKRVPCKALAKVSAKAVCLTCSTVCENCLLWIGVNLGDQSLPGKWGLR